MADIAKITLKGEREAKNFIDEALRGDIAYEELSTTVSKTGGYVAGDHLIYLGQYYEVVADIAQGGTIVTSGAGQNVEEREVGDEIKKNKTQVVAQIQTLTNKLNNEAATRSAMGAKNLIPFDLASIKAKNSHDYPSGSWNNNKWTMNGVTFAIQDDNTVVATGANTSNSSAQLDYYITIKGGVSYIANGCPSGGSYTTYEIANYCLTSPVETFHDLGNGVVITREAKTDILVHMQIKAGYTIDGQLVFKPMVRLASDTDDTYEPYAKSNRELTDELSLQNVEYTINTSIVNASPRLKLYKVGKAIIPTGYISTKEASVQGDDLFILTNEVAKDTYTYFTLTTTGGDIYLARFMQNGHVQLDSASMPTGGYIVQGVVLVS